jgi:long-chain acyl-CoA synthetase
MNIAEWLAATARARPEAPAPLTGFERDADYKTFARRAAAIGGSESRSWMPAASTGEATQDNSSA